MLRSGGGSDHAARSDGRSDIGILTNLFGCVPSNFLFGPAPMLPADRIVYSVRSPISWTILCGESKNNYYVILLEITRKSLKYLEKKKAPSRSYDLDGAFWWRQQNSNL